MLETTYSTKVCPVIRPNQVAQGFIPSDLENLRGWRLYNFSGQTAALLDSLHGKKDFPKSTWNLCCFNLSPLSLVIPPYGPVFTIVSTFLITSSYMLELVWNITFAWRFPFSRLNELLLPQPLITGTCWSLQAYCWSSAELTPIDWCPSVLRGPKLDVIF